MKRSQDESGERKELLNEGKVNDARVKYEQLLKIDACYARAREEEIKQALEDVRSQRIKPMYKFGLTAGAAVNKPLFNIGSVYRGSTTVRRYHLESISHVSTIKIRSMFRREQNRFIKFPSLNGDDHPDGIYRLGGIAFSLQIKIHPSNTNPNKIRPYFFVGREEIIPMLYEYEDYATLKTVQERGKLQNLISAFQGGAGIEMQKKHFGFFVEASGSYGMGGMYSNRALGPGEKRIDARFRRVGLDFGVRFR